MDSAVAIDAWLKHSMLRVIKQPMFEASRRWLKALELVEISSESPDLLWRMAAWSNARKGSNSLVWDAESRGLFLHGKPWRVFLLAGGRS